MSVYTQLTKQQLNDFIARFGIGSLVDYAGIEAGVTNSNYFIKTEQNEWVSTLLEELNAEQMAVILDLTQHLYQQGIPCPVALSDKTGQVLHTLANKPAVLVNFLAGKDIENVDNLHCEAIGKLLAEIHLAGKNFPTQHANTRGRDWFQATAEKLFSVIPKEDAALLKSELDFYLQQSQQDLPTGIIHADLFRDNVLFTHHKLTGVIDFYYACYDILLYDLAIVVNDWCWQEDTLNQEKVNAVLTSYENLRPLTDNEKQHWPAMLRAAALRFWLSRLKDYYFPTDGEAVLVKDPEHFKQVLLFYATE